MTLSEKLADARGRPSGFDYMRIALAIAVVCQHSMNTTMGLDKTFELLATPLRVPVAMILAMFFVLSGFLVAGSLLRSKSLVGFLGLRILRIVPALGVEVCIAALILGPTLTSYSLSEYFSDSKLYAYFLNILGEIHYKLPGLFLKNPVPEIVNGQLWTIPFELQCYAATAILALVGATFNRAAYLGLLIVAQLFLAGYVVALNPEPTAVLRGPILVFCFLVGVGLFLWKERIKHSSFAALVCTGSCAILLMVRNGDFFIAGPVAYVTCYLGVLNPPKMRFLQTGDYSYGIFLYGFPIQQAVSSIGPGLWHWWLNIALCVPLSALVAIFSWHAVEKHALELKSPLLDLEVAIIGKFRFLRFGMRPAWR